MQMVPTAGRPIPFHRFCAEQAPVVAGFLRGMVGAGEAEECLQETFIAALGAYERFDGRNPRAWILAIARRKALDAHRAGARRPAPLGGADQLIAAPTPPDTFGAEIWAEVAALPAKQRAAIVLRYGLDLRHREIGEVLGCSEDAARRSLHEGITKLRVNRTEEAA